MTVSTTEGGVAPLFPLAFRNEWQESQIEDAANNMRSSAKLGLPELPLIAPHQRTCVIVGGSPSVKDHLDTIRTLASGNVRLFGINASYNYLLDHGVVPDSFICFEVGPDQHVLDLRPDLRTTFYISSMCEPPQFQKLEGFNRVVWHVWSPLEVHKEALKEFPSGMLVCGGSSSLLRSINVALALGHRDFDIFGFDCSFTAEQGTHVTGTPNYALGDWREITAKSTTGATKTFLSRPSLARQADDFRQFSKNFGHIMTMRVHGDGLVPFIHREMFPGNYEDK